MQTRPKPAADQNLDFWNPVKAAPKPPAEKPHDFWQPAVR